MRERHARRLERSGRVVGTVETCITRVEEYARAFRGAVYRIEVAPGTTARLEAIGVRAEATVRVGEHPGMPVLSSGWNRSGAMFKFEAGQITIGLGAEGGAALEIFNSAIVGFGRVL